MGVDDERMIATSYPTFRPTWRALGATFGERALIIAIDGPAASGKGTLARASPRLRPAAPRHRAALSRDGARRCSTPAAARRARPAVAAARGLALRDFDEAVLRGREMGEAASVVAAIPEVRAALIEAQRAFAGARAARCSTGATSAR